jgi:putative SOS response-associated peptidase YedK
MCSNYRPATPVQLEKHFSVASPDAEYKAEAYPGYMAPMIRPPRPDAVPGDRTCALAMFGMVPHWAEEKLSRQTYNARTETVATKPSFRNAFKRRQFCIVPASGIYEPCYETGKAVRHEIREADGSPLGIAGIWEYKAEGPNGLPLLSMSMLTINADGHAVFQRMHKPVDEKRMLVIIPAEKYDEWLHSSVDDATAFFAPYPAERLVASEAPKTAKSAAQPTLPDV